MVIFHSYVSLPEGMTSSKKRFSWFNQMGVSENVVYPIVPNGFADPYPYEKWLFHWEYTLFSDKPRLTCFMYFVWKGYVGMYIIHNDGRWRGNIL